MESEGCQISHGLISFETFISTVKRIKGGNGEYSFIHMNEMRILKLSCSLILLLLYHVVDSKEKPRMKGRQKLYYPRLQDRKRWLTSKLWGPCQSLLPGGWRRWWSKVVSNQGKYIGEKMILWFTLGKRWNSFYWYSEWLHPKVTRSLSSL